MQGLLAKVYGCVIKMALSAYKYSTGNGKFNSNS